jgi:hypothetical protein
VVDKFALGHRIERGDRLVNFCGLSDLIITNTQLKQSKDSRYRTWEAPDGTDCNQINCIMISRKWRGSIRNSRAYPSTDIGSDHQLVMANLKLKLKTNCKKNTKYKADILRLKDEEICRCYKAVSEKIWEELLAAGKNQEQIELEEDWKQIQEILLETADMMLGRVKGAKNQTGSHCRL